MRTAKRFLCWTLWLVTCTAFGQAALPPNSPWLFAGFKGNSEDGVYYSLSKDGYHWTVANGGKPVVEQTEPGELMRDPFIQRAPDGSFVMVWTWSWKNGTIGFSSSKDLITWARHRELPVNATQPKAVNTWAPAIYWEPDQKRWLIFWSSTIPGMFPGDDQGDSGLNHRIWSTTTTDFKTLTPAKVYFDPGYSVIDATLVGNSRHRRTLSPHLQRRASESAGKAPVDRLRRNARGPVEQTKRAIF